MQPKNTFASALLFTAFSTTMILFSCQKESSPISNSALQSSGSDVSQMTLSLKHPIRKLEGLYDEVGTRTNYTGPVSDSIIENITDLSAYSPKIMTAIDDSTLVCDYSNLGTLGWQLIITLNNITRDISDVQPNLTMAESIIPGSFVVYAKKVKLKTKEFYFKTGYTNTAYNARINEETYTKQP